MNKAGSRPAKQGRARVGAVDGIVFDRVAKSFDRTGGQDAVEAIKEFSLEIAPKKFVALLGPSGCGKTTVLRLADGLLQPDAGTIQVFGAPPKPGSGIGFVFQSFRLIPWATVAQNIDFALQETGLDRAERRDRVARNIDLVGLSRYTDAYPSELSGGMQQRVALARALAPNPKALLMDEPFASIDAQTRELMQIELMRIWTDRRPVVMFVTHSVDEAILLADRVALIGPRPGKVIEVVDVELDRPRWTYDARAEKNYVDLRAYLSRRIRELVLSDPHSEFYGRDLGLPDTSS